MRNYYLATMAAAVISFPALPVQADPVFGIGLTLTFGTNRTANAGIGVRVFSDDENESTVAALGVDYMFSTKTVRGSLGVAYLKSDAYIEFSGGYHFATGDWDIGLGLGGTKTTAPSIASQPPASGPANPTGGGGSDSSPPAT